MHISVLAKEVLALLDPKTGENFIDATVGEGGHAFSILEKIYPGGKLLGIDLDKRAIENLKERSTEIILVRGNFSFLKKIVEEKNFGPVSGILADLGLSSNELENSGKGFSFLKDEVLDMRLGSEGQTAAELINSYGFEDLKEILEKFAEEKFASRIAKKIIEERKIKPIVTTFHLVEIITQATPAFYHHQRIHPATKTFQALRIAVNDELNNLASFLGQALEILIPGGRLAVISFHSLEDRIVKNFFRENQRKSILKILTKKPVRPGPEELVKNPRSRSARLRIAIKI
ncbi:MAG: 16S rRNA (cytosine(1402)-N(4))-methyltransferase RsmH [Candidatus Portnoybacteria bacterium]|nr:16S rRNA (cytosine(1402)-N(4))-methyltransferase RsmH [Candidatus Portnoybacteria bacterium]